MKKPATQQNLESLDPLEDNEPKTRPDLRLIIPPKTMLVELPKPNLAKRSSVRAVLVMAVLSAAAAGYYFQHGNFHFTMDGRNADVAAATSASLHGFVANMRTPERSPDLLDLARKMGRSK